MANPVSEFMALFDKGKPLSGRVISLKGRTARVATKSGMVEAYANARLKVGSRVRIVGGVAVPSLVPVSIYSV